jgi:hypothetical protein
MKPWPLIDYRWEIENGKLANGHAEVRGERTAHLLLICEGTSKAPKPHLYGTASFVF